MSYPKWRRKLRGLVGAELAKFIPIWVKLEPFDVPQDFFIELEFYDWWLEVKKYAKQNKIHPSLYNSPPTESGTGMAGAGHPPRKLWDCYVLGSVFVIDHLKNEWPLTLEYGGVAWVTLSDDRVSFTPIPSSIVLSVSVPREDYSPAERLCQIIDDSPQQFIDSLHFWHKHYQTYLKLTPIERRFLAAVPGSYRRDLQGKQYWQGNARNPWEPERFFPGVDPTNWGRHLRKLESLELIQVHRLADGNILDFTLEFTNAGALTHVCKQLLS